MEIRGKVAGLGQVLGIAERQRQNLGLGTVINHGSFSALDILLEIQLAGM
jgi:hypothetical protein